MIFQRKIQEISQKYKDYKIVKIIKFIYAYTLYTSNKKFKKAFIKLWKVYPYGFIQKEDIEKLIPQKVIASLWDDSFLIYHMDKDNKVQGYELGHPSLSLISMWKVEDFTSWVIFLTALLIVITLFIFWVSLKVGGIL